MDLPLAYKALDVPEREGLAEKAHRPLAEHGLAPLLQARGAIAPRAHARLDIRFGGGKPMRFQVGVVASGDGPGEVVGRGVLHEHGARLERRYPPFEEEGLYPEKAPHLRCNHDAAAHELALLVLLREELLPDHLADPLGRPSPMSR